MKYLILMIITSLTAATASASSGQARGSIENNVQKVTCSDKKTGRVRYELVRNDVGDRILFFISTDVYTGVFDGTPEKTMMLTDETDRALYFMSGFRPNSESLTVYKRTGEGVLITDNGYGILHDPLKLNCSIE